MSNSCRILISRAFITQTIPCQHHPGSKTLLPNFYGVWRSFHGRRDRLSPKIERGRGRFVNEPNNGNNDFKRYEIALASRFSQSLSTEYDRACDTGRERRVRIMIVRRKIVDD